MHYSVSVRHLYPKWIENGIEIYSFTALETIMGEMRITIQPKLNWKLEKLYIAYLEEDARQVPVGQILNKLFNRKDKIIASNNNN